MRNELKPPKLEFQINPLSQKQLFWRVILKQDISNHKFLECNPGNSFQHNWWSTLNGTKAILTMRELTQKIIAAIIWTYQRDHNCNRYPPPLPSSPPHRRGQWSTPHTHLVASCPCLFSPTFSGRVLALVFIWGGALRARFNCYFLGLCCYY